MKRNETVDALVPVTKQKEMPLLPRLELIQDVRVSSKCHELFHVPKGSVLYFYILSENQSSPMPGCWLNVTAVNLW